MTAQEYLQTRLNALRSGVLARSDGALDDAALFVATHARLMSKKFRKLQATPACQAVTERVLANAIKTKSPIVVSTLFGGNKLWRFDEAPEPDWAEMFNLLYYIDWMKTVVAVYPYGTVIDYYSQDISVQSLNNVPRSQTDAYSSTFRSLVAWLEPYLPKGVSIAYRRHYEEFKNPDDYYAELELGKQAVLQQNGGSLPVLTDAMKAATELNVHLRPGQDQDPLWREKVELEHQAIFQTKTLGKYLSDSNIITLCPTNYDDSDSIITGSTKRSYAKFWAAVGALQKDQNTFHELVLTPKQLESAHTTWEPVHFDGLSGKNFTRIRVLR